MRIGTHDTGKRVLVVAEIGNNHEGDAGVARELVERAAAAGADAVKFQTFRTEHYVSRADEERFARLERFRLDDDAFVAIAELARERGLLFVSTPFDLQSADFLAGFADALKIASGDNDFLPLLRRVGAARKPTIVSTGLAGLDEIRRAVGVVRGEWGGDDHGLAVLHCVSAYPAPPDEANLRAVTTLARELDCDVGYSDHTIGIDAAPVAVALGARIVEKHLTLDKAFSDFRDHQLSADPDEFAQLVARIRAVEAMLGTGEKVPQPSEEPGLVALRRSVVAAHDLRAGRRLEADDVTWVRPGGGLRPGEEAKLLGATLVRDVAAGERLSAEDVDRRA